MWFLLFNEISIDVNFSAYEKCKETLANKVRSVALTMPNALRTHNLALCTHKV